MVLWGLSRLGADRVQKAVKTTDVAEALGWPHKRTYAYLCHAQRGWWDSEKRAFVEPVKSERRGRHCYWWLNR